MGKSTRKAKVKLHPRRKRRVAPPRGPNVSLFHYLPNELLYIIRDFLPLDDLRSHIAFQSSCRQVRIVYAYDEKFWKAACIAYGIGKPNASKDFPYSISKCTWREIAILVVNHQECCDVPACARFVVPDHLKALWNKVKSPKEVHEQNIQYVGFDASIDFTLEELHGVSGPPRGMEPATLGQEKDLSLHTPGLCKFATSPPMQDIYINGLGFRLLVQNFYGVTVWDVIERIELFRWEHFSPTRLILAYEHHRHQLPCLNVFNWIETLTVGQCMPYIREILREPGNLDSHLSAELRRYRAWITQLHPLLPVRRLIVEAEDLFDRYRVEYLAQYLAARFPHLSRQPWIAQLKEFSSVERILRELIFEGLEAHPRQPLDKFLGADFDGKWKRRPGVYTVETLAMS